MPARKIHSFNVMLSDLDMAALERLARDALCAKSQVIRVAIRERARMVLEGEPICASGQRCYAPHLHAALRPATERIPE